jgi:hypothetical protein
MSSPTNTDILNEFKSYKIQDDAWKRATDKRLKNIERHAEYTNGKIAALSEKDIRREEREKWQAQQPERPIIERADTVILSRWFQNEKLVGAVASVLIAVAGAIGFLAGQA